MSLRVDRSTNTDRRRLRDHPASVLLMIFGPMALCGFVGAELASGYGLLLGKSGWAADSLTSVEAYTSVDHDGTRAFHGRWGLRKDASVAPESWDRLPRALSERASSLPEASGVSNETIREACRAVGHVHPRDDWGRIQIAEGSDREGQRSIAISVRGWETGMDQFEVREAVLARHDGDLTVERMREYTVSTDGFLGGTMLGLFGGMLFGAFLAHALRLGSPSQPSRPSTSSNWTVATGDIR